MFEASETLRGTFDAEGAYCADHAYVEGACFRIIPNHEACHILTIQRIKALQIRCLLHRSNLTRVIFLQGTRFPTLELQTVI